MTTRTAFLGPAFTFSERAAKALRPGDELVPCDTVGDAIGMLVRGKANFAVVALENSAAGYVEAALNALAAQDHGLVVHGEHVEPIHFTLYRRENDSAPLTLVVSDVMGLKQCRRWIEAEGVAEAPEPSNGHAFLRMRDGGEAGIGALGAPGIETPGVRAAAKDVQDEGVHFTRFVLLARDGEGLRTTRALLRADDAAVTDLAPTRSAPCGDGIVEAGWEAPGVEIAALNRVARGVLLIWAGA